MSGRSRHTQPDGRVTVGSRKTQRRNGRLDPVERLKRLQKVAGSGPDDFPVRVTFRLPPNFEPFVAQGEHGIGVQVMSGFIVRIGGHSAEQCFQKVRAFFADIARDRAPESSQAVLVSTKHPGHVRARYLTTVRDALVVSCDKPAVFEGGQ